MLPSQLIDLIAPQVQPLGYEIVHIEIQTHKGRVLRIYIDRLTPGEAIGVEDCAKVSRTIDTFLDESAEVQALFKGTYDLEVSSPGVFRPLRTEKDFLRFRGQEVRIALFRPLSAEEMGNSDYHSRNPKQKNFIGVLHGFRNNRVVLEIDSEEITIPLETVSKANLEPKFDLVSSKEGIKV